MSASYPNAIKTFTVKQDGVDDVMADHVNALQYEITAIETELGTNPKGDKADVKTRLDAIENSIDDLAGVNRTTETVKGNADAINSHVGNTNNPHNVTTSQIGAAPSSHTHTRSQITDFVHKSTHARGGSDPITPADIGAVNKAGDTMTGKLAVMQGDGLSTGGGQISAKPTGGANGQRGTISLYSTFENSTDKGVRRTADIVAGFDGGVWGTGGNCPSNV